MVVVIIRSSRKFPRKKEKYLSNVRQYNLGSRKSSSFLNVFKGFRKKIQRDSKDLLNQMILFKEDYYQEQSEEGNFLNEEEIYSNEQVEEIESMK